MIWHQSKSISDEIGVYEGSAGPSEGWRAQLRSLLEALASSDAHMESSVTASPDGSPSGMCSTISPLTCITVGTPYEFQQFGSLWHFRHREGQLEADCRISPCIGWLFFSTGFVTAIFSCRATRVSIAGSPALRGVRSSDAL